MLSDLNALIKKKKEAAQQPYSTKANEQPLIFDQLIKPSDV
jgi:hypothetical protein